MGLLATSCSRDRGNGYEGHAFVANEEGGVVAAVNLTAFAVTRHIAVGGRPDKVVCRPMGVWALSSSSGTIHEIDPERVELRRKASLASSAVDLQISKDGNFLWLLAREPKRLIKIDTARLTQVAAVSLPDVPTALSLAAREPLAVVLFAEAPPMLIHTDDSRQVSRLTVPYAVTLGRFRSDDKQLILAGAKAKLASFVNVPDGRTLAHVPLAIEPRNIAVKPDGGEVYLTGDGLDAVVVLYPYLGEVGETVLAGRKPSAMTAVSTPGMSYLFVANPEAGNVTVLDLATHRMVGAVSVGKEPSFLTATPDGQYALVLNRASGDMGVIRVKAVTRNRGKSAPLFTMIPVGSRPVAAAVV